MRVSIPLQALKNLSSLTVGQLAPLHIARTCRLVSQLPRLTKLRLLDLSLLRQSFEVCNFAIGYGEAAGGK